MKVLQSALCVILATRILIMKQAAKMLAVHVLLASINQAWGKVIASSVLRVASLLILPRHISSNACPQKSISTRVR